MAHTTFALFSDSQVAGEAVAELKEHGFAHDVSIIAKDEKGDLSHEQVKHDLRDGATAGAVAGGIFGLVAAAVALTPLSIAGLLVGGPLVSLWGAATGALTGGLVGALVDAGIPEERARIFEDRIRKGEVLVAVTTSEEKVDKAKRVLAAHSAEETVSFSV